MKARVYLETTIPSYLVARPSRDLRLLADQQVTQEWWEERRGDFDLVIFGAVIREVSRGDAAFASARLEKLRGLPLLPRTPVASGLIRKLLADGVIPPKAADDAVHIGLAAAHGVEHLLTWNCRHINNHSIRRRIESACAALGLGCPDICSPPELMNP